MPLIAMLASQAVTVYHNSDHNPISVSYQELQDDVPIAFQEFIDRLTLVSKQGQNEADNDRPRPVKDMLSRIRLLRCEDDQIALLQLRSRRSTILLARSPRPKKSDANKPKTAQ